MNSDFSIKEAFEFGWKKTNENIRFFPILTFALIGIILISNIIVSNVPEGSLPEIAMSVLMTFFDVIITLGLIRISLNVFEGQKPKVSMLSSENEHFFRYFFASLLYAIIIIVGLVFLIIPGIILAIRLRFFGYAIVEKKLSIIESLKESFRVTKGYTWKLFLFTLALFFINILGFIPLGLGLLFTAPISIMAVVFVWKQINNNSTVTSSQETDEFRSNVILE